MTGSEVSRNIETVKEIVTTLSSEYPYEIDVEVIGLFGEEITNFFQVMITYTLGRVSVFFDIASLFLNNEEMFEEENRGTLELSIFDIMRELDRVMCRRFRTFEDYDKAVKRSGRQI